MAREKLTYKLATLDFETDPFMYGRVPQPFAVELYTDETVFTAWGDDCVIKLINYLETLEEPHRIYAHNGGKFDFFFIYPYLDNPIRIINNRIVSAKLFNHNLRDSFAIMPFALRAYAKDDIDYKKLERHRREKHKAEILSYLHTDCLRLYELCAAFNDRFGPMLTIGSTAMSEIQARYDFERMNEEGDAFFRQFYYGGRVECFHSGILEGPFVGLDFNSAYPYVMANRRHPVNARFDITNKLPDNFDLPYFAHIRAKNNGALPSLTDDAARTLTFNQKHGDFFACSHEIEVALKYGLIEIEEVYSCHVSQEWISFDKYVNDFYAEKVRADQIGDKILRLFAKFLLNSGYGKFGQNPANYKDWFINRDFGNDRELMDYCEKDDHSECTHWTIAQEFETFELWEKPATIKDSSFYDVSIAASITSGTRALLLDALQHAVHPVYCDTDSIICRTYKGELDATKLGMLKTEFEASHMAIAGKKLYMAYDAAKKLDKVYDPKGKGNPVKLASKGGAISPADLLKVAQGKEISYHQQSPTFSLTRATRFQTRRFNKTVVDDPVDEG